MIRSNVAKSTIAGQVQVENRQDGGAVLAAVLAAALVEYGKHLQQHNGNGGPQDARGNWQTLACLDRLQGRA